LVNPPAPGSEAHLKPNEKRKKNWDDWNLRWQFASGFDWEWVFAWVIICLVFAWDLFTFRLVFAWVYFGVIG
jgi:hypothetical protein